MNWGYRILLLYIGFVAMIVVLVVFAMRQRVDLVSKDYYAEELKFQERIDKVARTRELPEQLTWNLKEGKLTLTFPPDHAAAPVSGTVFFFRPSDESKDRLVQIRVNNAGLQVIPISDMHPGVYTMGISWQAGNVKFYNEGVITIAH